MEKIRLRTLGPLEAKVVLSLQEQGHKTVNIDDIRSLVGAGSATRNVILQLTRKGWMARVRRGRFVLLPAEHGPDNLGENNPFGLATAAETPSYIGWWSAASFHGFTTQIPLTVFVAVMHQARSRELEGSSVHFVRILKRKFFGFQHFPVYGRDVPISTPVKTLIDCLDRPSYAGGVIEVARITSNALAKVTGEDAVDAAIKFGSKSVMQRLGAMSDLTNHPLTGVAREKLLAAIPQSARSRFGRGEPRPGDIGYMPDWGLYIDAHANDLLAEVSRVGTGHDRGK